MNTKLKSILLSTAFIATSFGSDKVSALDEDVGKLSISMPMAASAINELSTCAFRASVTLKGLLTLAFGARVPLKGLLTLAFRAACSAAADEKPHTSLDLLQHTSLDLLQIVSSYMPTCELPAILEVYTELKATQTIQDRQLLREKVIDIIACLHFTPKPVHEVLQANGLDDPRHLMSNLGIKADTCEGRDVGSYEQTNRKEIVAKLAHFAEMPIITAEDILKGAEVKDGAFVTLSYNQMIQHKAALDGKDIHLCVDVYANKHGQLVWDNTNLPHGLKKLCFSNTQKDVEIIKIGFLSWCKELNQVDLSGLTKVISIGAGFLCGCTGLTQVNLSGLTNVTHIRYNFLIGCTGLTEIKVRRDQKALVEQKISKSLQNKIIVVN